MLMSVLNVIIGNTGGGLIDFLIWGVFELGSHWYWVIIVGVFYAVIYYYVFKWYLTKKHISVDVSVDDAPSKEDTKKTASEKMQQVAVTIIEGLGGLDNIVAVNNCISRLRVDVKDMKLVNEDKIKKTGSLGIIKPSETHIQIVYGPKIDAVANAVREVMKY